MNKSFYALTTALVLAVCAPAALTAASEDETAIRQLCASFVTAWNHHDAKGMAAVWAEDGDLVNPFGRAAKGRAEIEKLLGGEHSTVMRASTYTAVGVNVRLLAPTLAVSEWTSEVTGMLDPKGAAMPAFKHQVMVVHEKRNGQWYALMTRAWATPTLPPAP